MTRSRVVVLMVVVTSGVVGCMSGGPLPWNQPPAPAQTYTPPPTPTTSPAEARQARASVVLTRGAAIKKRIVEALALDGTREAETVHQAVLTCQTGRDACMMTAHGQRLVQLSATGAYAGGAHYLIARLEKFLYLLQRYGRIGVSENLDPVLTVTDEDLDLAETFATSAKAEAQKVVDARAEKQRQMDAEMAAITEAMTACDSNPSACKSKCDVDKAPNSCFAMAVRLRNARKVVDARPYVVKACDGGVQNACVALPNIDKEIEQATAQVDGLWAEIVSAGDDLAQKYHQVSVAASLNTPRLRRAIPQMMTINRAIVSERYCPAKRAFLAVSNAADFQRRAVAHCRDQAPTATGLSGAEVSLTAECVQVYATGCP